MSLACSTGTEETPEICATDVRDGAWSEQVEPWDDPGAPDNECLTADFFSPGDPSSADSSGGSTTDGSTPDVLLLDCVDDNHCQLAGFDDAPDDIVAHHCYTTAVHAVHMWTGELLLYHGERDERVWPIARPPEETRWHPVPHETLRWRSNGTSWAPEYGQPDLFCTGHVQVGNDVFTAGGNVNGSPAMGGLRETYRFSPWLAAGPLSPEPVCAYGWSMGGGNESWGNTSPRMAYDRWYPTLTVLGDGRVLISGGTTQLLDHDPETFKPAAEAVGEATALETETPYLEIYDPTTSPATITLLPNAPFPAGEGVPQYPFMFVLPNGDVAYAGALAADRDPGVQQQDGRILVADYNHPDYVGTADPELWEWAPVRITSEFRGGSAVMFSPGRILKTGGLAPDSNVLAIALSETVDLSDWPNTVPTAFVGEEDPEHASNMRRSRQFHTLTLLPDGSVLATGGNDYSNGQTGEHWNNPCIDSSPCEEGCPSVCVDVSNQFPQNGLECGDVEPDFQCSLFRDLSCNCDAAMSEVACDQRAPLCAWVGAACIIAVECSDVGPGFESATCGANGRCELACTPGEQCGDIMPIGGECPFESPRFAGNCDPRNNACYAQYAAEIYDPTCNTWTLLEEQSNPRMYHSTALLLPDARVISMGGGHRQGLEEQTEAEYFEPVYGGPSAGPEFRFGMPTDYEAAGPDDAPLPSNYLAWEVGELQVVVENDVIPAYATLMRLGSVTHGFDMDQRALRLAVSADNDDNQYTIEADPDGWPITPDTVPPGHYMLFLLTAGGEPGTAQYVKVGSAETADAEYVCEATGTFAASEASCNLEPVAGVCPTAGVVSTPVAAPTVDGTTGPVAGFNILAPAALIDDQTNPTEAELMALGGYCAHVCAAHYGDQLSQSGNCDEPGALAPAALVDAAAMTLDLIGTPHRHGEDLFAGQVVACDLGSSCHDAFDETLRLSAPSRVTPAGDAEAVGEEFRMTVSGSMGVDSPATADPVAASLTGTVGFSHCAGGNATDPCPFYLGSLQLDLTESFSVPLVCDGSSQTYEVESMSIHLAQPAFGIAQEATSWKAFPPGSLIFEGEAVIDGVPFAWRRPNEEPVYALVTNGWIQVQGIGGSWIEFTVPCGEGEAEVLAWWGFQTSATIGTPPGISINVASAVSCPRTVALSHSKWDSQNDIVSTRWLVDGVLMAPGTTSVPFTVGHTLTAVVRDSRGATTTKSKAVGCL